MTNSLKYFSANNASLYNYESKHIYFAAYLRRSSLYNNMADDTVVNSEDCKGNVNANPPEQKQTRSVGTSSSSTTKRKSCIEVSSSFLRNVWFTTQCILCHVLLLVVTIPLAPLMMLFYLLKATERFIVKMRSGKIALSPFDAIWAPRNADDKQLIISSLICFENDGNFEDGVQRIRDAMLERLVEARKDLGMLLYPRARCYIQPGLFQFFFVEDHSFSIDNHVFTWKGKVPCSKDELSEVVSTIINEPLAEHRPLWCCCCIQTNFGDNDLALVFRMHHSLADGIALIQFLIHQLADKLTLQVSPQSYSSTFRFPLLAKAALIAPRYLLKLQFRSTDSNLLHGPDLNGEKKVAWSDPIDLQLIKEIKAATGTTVNDVLMSCLSLAVRRYLQRKGVEDPSDITAAVPVNVRASVLSEKLIMDNKFAFIFPRLAVGTEGVLSQLYETKIRMDKAKTSGEPIASATVFSISNELYPDCLTSKSNAKLGRKPTCILSNIRGPQKMLSVRGSRVKYLVFWPPHKENLGTTLSVFTYSGKVFVGVQGDIAVLSDPELIVEEFGKAVNEMTKCVLETTGFANEGCQS